MINRKILLLEDDPEIIPLISYILQDIGCIVIPSSAENCLKDIEIHKPQVILLDYWLGGALGSDLCKGLKQNPSTSQIPVILISAVNGVQSIAESCEADDSLAKPFDIDDLTNKILLWLDKSASGT